MATTKKIKIPADIEIKIPVCRWILHELKENFSPFVDLPEDVSKLVIKTPDVELYKEVISLLAKTNAGYAAHEIYYCIYLIKKTDSIFDFKKLMNERTDKNHPAIIRQNDEYDFAMLMAKFKAGVISFDGVLFRVGDAKNPKQKVSERSSFGHLLAGRIAEMFFYWIKATKPDVSSYNWALPIKVVNEEQWADKFKGKYITDPMWRVRTLLCYTINKKNKTFEYKKKENTNKVVGQLFQLIGLLQPTPVFTAKQNRKTTTKEVWSMGEQTSPMLKKEGHWYKDNVYDRIYKKYLKQNKLEDFTIQDLISLFF